MSWTASRRKRPRWSSARTPDRSSRRQKHSASNRSTRRNSCAVRTANPKLAAQMTVPSVLRQLHASLAAHAPDQLVTVLQEAGYAAGEGSYRGFAAWLRERAGVDSPANLDAGLLAEMLSDFFASADDTVAVMEVECRSKGDARCRFLSAPPDVLDRVYQEMTAGRTYEEALSAGE